MASSPGPSRCSATPATSSPTRPRSASPGSRCAQPPPSGRPPHYGHRRGGIVVAALNGAVLVVIAAAIAVGAITRLQHPAAVSAVPVIVVRGSRCSPTSPSPLLHGAGGGPGGAQRRCHVIADALTDAGVVVAASACSSLAGLRRRRRVIAHRRPDPHRGAGLLAEALHILNEGTPPDLDVELCAAASRHSRDRGGPRPPHLVTRPRAPRALRARQRRRPAARRGDGDDPVRREGALRRVRHRARHRPARVPVVHRRGAPVLRRRRAPRAGAHQAGEA